jgi:hypothetical protein
MSFSLLPLELNCHTIGFIQPEKFTPKAIKKCARQLVYISLVNNKFNQICSKNLTTLNRIYHLVNKYFVYNDDYEVPETKREFDPKGNPQLLDALSSGCMLPYVRNTFAHFTPETERDIIDIVNLTPQSMNCVLGTLRCRQQVPPLAAACFNVAIPLHIIEFLLQKGANPHATLLYNGRPISILNDLQNNLVPERFAAIKILFNRYGAV